MRSNAGREEERSVRWRYEWGLGGEKELGEEGTRSGRSAGGPSRKVRGASAEPKSSKSPCPPTPISFVALQPVAKGIGRLIAERLKR